MSVVIISATPFSGGEEVAARAAALLQYRSVGRDEVIEAAARTYDVPPDKLVQALDEPPGWRRTPVKERRIRLAAIQAAVSDSLLEGNCVCHGLAAHLYVTGISHVLKVRLNTLLEARIEAAARQRQLSEAKARKLVLGLDKRRQRWVTSLFKVDENDTATFDLAIDTGEVSCEEAAALIADTARQRRFKPMTYSVKQYRDYALASRVRAVLVEIDPEVVVHADDGVIHIEAKAVAKKGDKVALIKQRALAVPHVEKVEVDVIDDIFARAAVSMR
jgi:cytidylate kinase